MDIHRGHAASSPAYMTPSRQRSRPSCTVLPVDTVHGETSPLDTGDVTAADLTLRQAAALAGCSPKTVRRAIHAGELPSRYASTAHGAQFSLPYADVDQWARRRRASAAPGAPPPTVDTGLDTSGPVDMPVGTGHEADHTPSQQVDTSTLVQHLLQQIVAPLTAEIARLNDVTRTQAEELGALRERMRVAEAAPLAERPQPHAPAAPVDKPTPAIPTPEATPARPRLSRWEKARAALRRALS